MKTPKHTLTRRRLLKTIGVSTFGSIAGATAVNAIAPFVLPETLEFDTNASHWSLALPPANPPLHRGIDADVVVLGGGFTGLSTAYYLTRTLPGKRIVLLEAKRCGNGASGRNGAMVLNRIDSEADPVIGRRLYDLTLENIRTLARLSAEFGIGCELEQNGALTVMADAAEVRAAREELAGLSRQGVPVQFWDAAETAATIGTRAYEGAWVDPGAGQVHPGKLVRLWKAAAEFGGVTIYDQTPVINIQEGAVHTLTTAAGYRVRTPLLVLATNAYTSKLGFLRGAVAPIFDYVCITPVLEPSRLDAIGWKTRIPFNDSRRELYYAGRTMDGRIHFGGGRVDYMFNNGVRNSADAAQRYAHLHREFARVFPSLTDVPFERGWSGLVDMSLDENPAVGRTGRHDNILYALGYSGEGVNLTSVFGRVIADLAAGRRDPWAWLPYLDRLPPYVPNEPFRWLGIRASLEYSRITDR